MLRIGVLALQGDFREHLIMLEKCDARGVEVKSPAGLHDIDGLIIPGGESTTIGKLMGLYGLIEPLKERISNGLALFGTCAGLVLMGSEVVGEERGLLGVMDMVVKRNAFGRQVDSFEADLRVRGIEGEEQPFHAVFIRAPWVQYVDGNAEVLAKAGENNVMVKQGRHIACSFHPELTEDIRIHKYFLDLVREDDERVEGG